MAHLVPAQVYFQIVLSDNGSIRSLDHVSDQSVEAEVENQSGGALCVMRIVFSSF